MAVQPLRKDESRNPRTIEEARSLVKHVESLFLNQLKALPVVLRG